MLCVIAIKNIEELFIKVSNYQYNGQTYDTLYYGNPSLNTPAKTSATNNPGHQHSWNNIEKFFYNDMVRINGNQEVQGEGVSGAKVVTFFSIDNSGGSNSQNLLYAQTLWPKSHQDVMLKGSSKADNLNLWFSHNNYNRTELGMGSDTTGKWIKIM